MPQFKIVDTNNYAGDYPDEKFVERLPYLSSKEDADRIANVINDIAFKIGYSDRFWKTVEMPYKLQPGFEP
jgi:hypothetical protein